MFGESFGVDGSRRNDYFEVRTPRQDLLQSTEQKVDVERSFVGFVDDDRVVLFKESIALRFSQQNAIGHQLDIGFRTGRVSEANLETDSGADN